MTITTKNFKKFLVDCVSLNVKDHLNILKQRQPTEKLFEKRKNAEPLEHEVQEAMITATPKSQRTR